MLPMLPMQRVSGSGSGRALSAALLSRECIMCSRDCGSRDSGSLSATARAPEWVRSVSPLASSVIRVIRENPSAARGVAGAPKNRQRNLSVHRSGWSWNAGPQQWYGGSEALQAAAQWTPPPGQSSPPPIRLPKIRRRKAPGGRGLGNLEVKVSRQVVYGTKHKQHSSLA